MKQEKFVKYALFDIPFWIVYSLNWPLTWYVWTNLSEDTSYLSNYGFAITASISSLLFSWARAADQSAQKQLIRELNEIAVISLWCGILFVFASIIKFVSLHIGEYLICDPMVLKVFYYFLYLIYIMIFSSIMLMLFPFLVIRKILDIISLNTIGV